MPTPRSILSLTLIVVAIAAMGTSDATAGQSRQSARLDVENSLTFVSDAGPYRLTSDLRIKRMHLVRPDLIGYPTLQDIYA